LDLLHDGLHERGGVLVVKKETCSCHRFVFHAVSIAPRRPVATAPSASSGIVLSILITSR
jgi:hypothetical protein